MLPPPAHVRKLILSRLTARRLRERQQMSLLAEADTFHETIRGKLHGLLDSNQFVNFSRCGIDNLYMTCRGCKAVTVYRAQCNLKWCPRCQWRIIDQRKKVLALWANTLSQPKHLVTTVSNVEVLTRSYLKKFTGWLAKLRRTKSFKDVRGGCVSIEVTHEGRGWHPHAHWLLDADWLDMPSVAKAWAKLVGQEFAIVKVKDCREKSYLQEVTKYVCDGSEMSKWAPEHLLEFVVAIRGKRFFFPFGSLFKKQPDIRRALLRDRPPGRICECGCEDFIYETETAAVLADLRRNVKRLRGSPAERPPSKRSPVGGSRRRPVEPDQPELLEGKSFAVEQSPTGGVLNALRR